MLKNISTHKNLIKLKHDQAISEIYLRFKKKKLNLKKSNENSQFWFLYFVQCQQP